MDPQEGIQHTDDNGIFSMRYIVFYIINGTIYYALSSTSWTSEVKGAVQRCQVSLPTLLVVSVVFGAPLHYIPSFMCCILFNCDRVN